VRGAAGSRASGSAARPDRVERRERERQAGRHHQAPLLGEARGSRLSCADRGGDRVPGDVHVRCWASGPVDVLVRRRSRRSRCARPRRSSWARRWCGLAADEAAAAGGGAAPGGRGGGGAVVAETVEIHRDRSGPRWRSSSPVTACTWFDHTGFDYATVAARPAGLPELKMATARPHDPAARAAVSVLAAAYPSS